MAIRSPGARPVRAALVVLVTVLGASGWLLVGGTASATTAAAAGAGHTIIEGGTGGSAPAPVTTLVSFHATAAGGDFECLALAPGVRTGAGSGTFSVNVMYVTGRVTSLTVTGERAVLRGVATVTGLGAGQRRPFTAVVHQGGPGTTVALDVSGFTFHETLIDGRIAVRGS